MKITAFSVIFTLALLPCFAWAGAPEELATPESIGMQVVAGSDSEAPHFVTGEALVSLVKRLIPFGVDGANVLFNRNSGQLFVRNTPSNQELVGKILNELRASTRQQIDIEARIVTVSSTDFSGLGQDFAGFDITRTHNGTAFGTTNTVKTITSTASAALSGFQANYNTGIDFPRVLDADSVQGSRFSFFGTSDRINIESAIEALESIGEVNTLSAPRVTVFNNQRANIKIEDARNYLSSVNYELGGVRGTVATSAVIVRAVAIIGVARGGTILDVTPTINDDGTITLDLHPTFVRVDLTKTQTFTNRFSSEDFDNTVTLPIFETQSIDTTLTIPNGGVAVLGGIITETETKNIRKTPLLGDLPIIGKIFFQNEQNQQIRSYLVMFVRATLRNAESNQKAVDATR